MTAKGSQVVVAVLCAVVWLSGAENVAAQHSLQLTVTVQCEGQPVSACPLLVGTKEGPMFRAVTQANGTVTVAYPVADAAQELVVLVQEHLDVATTPAEAIQFVRDMDAIYEQHFVGRPYVFVAGQDATRQVDLEFERAHKAELRFVAPSVSPSPPDNVNGLAWLEGVAHGYEIQGSDLEVDLFQMRYGAEWDVYAWFDVDDVAYMLPVHSDAVLLANGGGNRYQVQVAPPARDVLADVTVTGYTGDYAGRHGPHFSLISVETGHAYVCTLDDQARLAPLRGEEGERLIVPDANYVLAYRSPTKSAAQIFINSVADELGLAGIQNAGIHTMRIEQAMPSVTVDVQSIDVLEQMVGAQVP